MFTAFFDWNYHMFWPNTVHQVVWVPSTWEDEASIVFIRACQRSEENSICL